MRNTLSGVQKKNLFLQEFINFANSYVLFYATGPKTNGYCPESKMCQVTKVFSDFS